MPAPLRGCGGGLGRFLGPWYSSGDLGTLIPAAFRGCSVPRAPRCITTTMTSMHKSFLAGLHFVDHSEFCCSAHPRPLTVLSFPKGPQLPIGVSRRASTVGDLHMQ